MAELVYAVDLKSIVLCDMQVRLLLPVLPYAKVLELVDMWHLECHACDGREGSNPSFRISAYGEMVNAP